MVQFLNYFYSYTFAILLLREKIVFLNKKKAKIKKYWREVTFNHLHYGVMVIILDMNTATQVQIPDLAVYFLNSTNSLGEGMNPTILSPAIG